MMTAEKKIEQLYDELVPASGKADTVAGEIIRAVCRIVYRNWNDGDHIGVGYGKETCNPAARFLKAKAGPEVAETIASMWGMVSDALYDKAIELLEEQVVAFIESHPELKAMQNINDMWDFRDRLEDVDDSWDDEDGERECRMLGELDYDELTRGDWDYDEGESYFEQEDFEEWFKDKFCKRFPSFRPTTRKHWISRYRRAILESDLFYIAIEDNEWSLAVELIQKDNEWTDHGWMRNLQGRHHQKYLDEMKRLLLQRFGSIGLYAGAWTSGRLTREEYEAEIGRKVGA